MKNPVRGEIEVEFGERKVTLKLTANAMCMLEEETDRPLGQILADFENLVKHPEKVKIADLRVIFWATMLEDWPEATVKDAGDLMTSLDGGWMPVLANLMRAGFGAMAGGEGK